MWIVASNFIVPDLLSLAQLIVLFSRPRYNVAIYMFSLYFINSCIEVIGVLFATVWAAKNHWQTEDSVPPTFSLGLGSRNPEASTEGAMVETPSWGLSSAIHSIAGPVEAEADVPAEKSSPLQHHGTATDLLLIITLMPS